MDNSSGVGVLDKAVLVLTCLEGGPTSLAGLVARTGLSRPTAHRLAVALEHHRLVTRDAQGRFVLGPRLRELALAAPGDLLLQAAPVESAQLYRREGTQRRCIAAAERASGLRDTVPVGSTLSMGAGSAAQVLLAWEPRQAASGVLENAAFTPAALAGVRKRGWAQSVAEREPGVASVSAPVHSPDGNVVASISVSGPIERLTRTPGKLHAQAVIAAGAALSRALAPASAG
jgi:DNA-binding IclR family transcriptional regulator